MHTLAASDLVKVIDQFGIVPDSRQIADSLYAIPTRDWVVNKFAPRLHRFLVELHTDKYRDEANDCDNFAVLSYALAQACEANTDGPDAALTFGEFWYLMDVDGSGHAINVFFTFEGETPQVYFFEPQTQQIVQLSSSERRNCCFIRF